MTMNKNLFWGTGSSSLSNVVTLDDFRENSSSSIIEASRENLQKEVIDLCLDARGAGEDFSVRSAEKAIDFVRDLSLFVECPTLALQADGLFLAEWSRRESNGSATIFSVLFATDGYVFATWKEGRAGVTGMLNYCDESIITLEQLIRQNFGARTYAKQTSTRRQA